MKEKRVVPEKPNLQAAARRENKAPDAGRQRISARSPAGPSRGTSDTAGVVGRLARAATGLLGSVPGGIGSLIEEAGRLAGGLERAVGRLLGGVVPEPGRDPLPPAIPGPVAPPPAVPSGCSTPGGFSLIGSGACGAAAKTFHHQFVVFDPFLVSPTPEEGEILWLSREPLMPSSAPRPPNDRPG